MNTDKSAIISTIENFLNTREGKSYQFNEDTKLNLQLFGEDTETLLLDIYITQSPRRTEDKVMLISRPIFEDEEDDIDSLSHLSADECSRILAEIRRQIRRDEFSTIQKYLNENDADYDDIAVNNAEVEVSVSWGDWKHSHRHLDNLMSNLGYIKDDEDVTEEDGSDTYSSIHYYKRVNNVSI